MSNLIFQELSCPVWCFMSMLICTDSIVFIQIRQLTISSLYA